MSEQNRDGSYGGKDEAEVRKTAANGKLPKRKAPRKCAPKPERFELGVEPLPKR